MAKNSLRIVIPKKIDGKLKLASLVYQKHKVDGKDSPLNALSDYNWDEHGPKVEKAKQKHEEAEEHRRRMEQAYRDRDMLLVDVDGLIKSTRDLLKGIFKKSPKKLGEWGYEVNDTPRPGKPD